MYLKIISLYIVSSFLRYSEGQLVCYACSFSSVDTDRSCLTITNSTPIVNCVHQYCTIMRQEFRIIKNTPFYLIPILSHLNLNKLTVRFPFAQCEPQINECDPQGLIASFTRSCLSSPDFLNHEVVDPTFRTFYRACTSNRCNIGDGIQSVTGSNLSPRPENNGTNLLVPGTGASSSIKSNVMILLFTVFIVFIFNQ